MDLDQLKTDLQGLSTMADSSRKRLAELVERLGALRARLEGQLSEPTAPDSPPSES